MRPPRPLLPLAAFTMLVVWVAPAPDARAQGGRSVTPGKRRDEVVDVYDKVKAAVVNIHSERTVAAETDPFRQGLSQTQRVNGMGTGIVLDPRGFILTNFHVVDEVNSLRVRLHDGTGFPAKVFATDKEHDLAILKIDTPRPLPVMPIGTSADLMVGEPVIAIGNAYGYEHTVTNGRVSFKGRDVTLNKDMGYKGLIQTSAPINPGNSGGPLMNVLGELVGVNVAIRAGAQNIGFALPIDAVIVQAADMMSVKRRSGMRHGLAVRDAAARDTAEESSHRTVTVEGVEPGSPAAAAGFKPGDVLEQVDDVQVVTSIDLERALLDRGSARVPVKVRRAESGSVELALELQPLPRTAPTPADLVWRKLGVKLQPVGPEAVVRANPQLRGGMLVTEVSSAGPAASAGIVKGDILVGLAHWESLSLDNVAFVLNHKDFASFQPLRFFRISRDGKLENSLLNNIP